MLLSLNSFSKRDALQMLCRNPHLSSLSPSYLFVEISKRVKAFKEQHPEAQVLSLSIGDTSEPLSPVIANHIATLSQKMVTREGYRGYGPEQGIEVLRKEVANIFYQQLVDPSDIFISDGAKCDLARLHLLWGPHKTIGVQNPTYPAFVDASLLQGQKIYHLPCLANRDFFPALPDPCPFDILYFCSPGNPTGTAASYEQMHALVSYCLKHKVLLLFDSAYAGYIEKETSPPSIYHIPGAKEVAIEVGSFSKWAGFTGIRLGWTIVPKELLDGNGHSLRNEWNRIITTIFNGASCLSQEGGLAALSQAGFKAIQAQIAHYKENASILKEALVSQGYVVYGGRDAPYLWVAKEGKKGWDLFQEFLFSKHIVTTPGIGFGSEGDLFIRFSALARREVILAATKRIHH